MRRKQIVCIAMSGGVDSSVAAALLKDEGHDVIGVTLQIWQESQRDPRHAGCCSLGAVDDARRVAQILDIPHYVLNFQDEFRESVIDEFVSEYAAGRTPNPCVTCNKTVKFAELLKTAEELGCDRLATGHYARIRFDKATDRYQLLRANGSQKDQSYVLYMLSQEQLAKIWFPIGELADKASTRKLAREYGLPVADKPDSQEICFVSEAGGYREFLAKKIPDAMKSGEMVDRDGKVLGRHTGVANYTVGQRRGLGISSSDPLYVLEIRPQANQIVVGPDEQLLETEVLLEDVVWSGLDETDLPTAVSAKIRYNMDAKAATILGGDDPRIIFDEPVRAVTPGQIAVAYRGEAVVAGGTIR